MGINARLRYGIAWILVRVLMKLIAWLNAGLSIINISIAYVALWFSPEFTMAEAKRLLESVNIEE